MLTIFEYRLLGAFTEWRAELPAGAELLHFGVIAGALYVWARVDPALPTVTRTLFVFKTGDALPADRTLEHRATVQTPMLGDVWHIFEEVPHA